jgi:hypothetical protein
MVRWDVPDPLVIHWPGLPIPHIYYFPYLYPDLMDNLEYALQFAVNTDVNPLHTVRPPAWQKVEAWRERVFEAIGEVLAGEEQTQRQVSLVDLANLPPSPSGDSEPSLHDDTEEILQAALSIITSENDQSSVDTMVPGAAEESQSQAAKRLAEDGFGTPTPIMGNFIPVSHASPSSHHQLLQPAVYEPTKADSSQFCNSGAA